MLDECLKLCELSLRCPFFFIYKITTQGLCGVFVYSIVWVSSLRPSYCLLYANRYAVLTLITFIARTHLSYRTTRKVFTQPIFALLKSISGCCLYESASTAQHNNEPNNLRLKLLQHLRLLTLIARRLPQLLLPLIVHHLLDHTPCLSIQLTQFTILGLDFGGVNFWR